jgi:DNA-binding response OmpR family regulator
MAAVAALADSRSFARATAPATVLSPGNAPRILVVDGNACMRGLLRLHLANAGYEVDTAEDAVVALKSIMRRPPELMIVDVDMPYLNGLEFVGAIRSDPRFSAIAVMFLTIRSDLDEQARSLGALACLQKPLLAPELIATVAAALPNGRVAIG